MSNSNTNLQTQTSSVLQNVTVSSCSNSNIQEKTQLSRSRCMHSLKEIKSLFKFLSETLQDYGTMPIFKRTFSQDLDLLEQHLTKDILSRTDCTTTLTDLRTTFENAFNSELKAPLNVDSLKVDLVVIQDTCSEKEDSNSETASSKLVKECSLNFEIKDVHAIKYKMTKAKERCVAYFRSLHSHLQINYKRHLDKRIKFQEDGSMAAFWVVNNQFQKFIDSKFTLDYDSQMTDTYFVEYTGLETQESNIERKALDADLVDTESIRTDSTVQDDSSRSGNDTDADDADIRPIYDEEPMAEVQLTAECNIFAIGQQHTEQPEIIVEGRVDQYPETCQVKSLMLDSSPDNQTTEYSKQSLESENILLKETKQTTSLLAKNADLKAQIQEKVFAIAALKNDLRKLKGNSVELVDKTSVFGKPWLPSTTKTISSKKKIQERDRNSTTSVPTSARIQTTTDDRKPNPRSNNQTSRSLPVSKSSRVTITAVPKARSLKEFLEVNSRAKIQSNKTTNSNKPVDQKSHTQKPSRQIFTGHRFSPKKTSAVSEKTSPRSDLSKVDSEPPHGSNVDIPHIHECKQTLDSMVAEKADISETIVKVDSQMMIQNNDVCSQQFRPRSSMSNDGRMPTKIELTLEQSQQGVSNDVLILRFVAGNPVKEILESTSSQDKTTVLQPHSSEVGFINHMLLLNLSKSIVQHQDS
ncbi:hypothetical protein Tco_0881871 [Tanacetum coccineum]